MGTAPRKMQLGGEAYIAAAAALPAAGQAKIQIVVLKSYDRASEYLRRVNRWVLALGVATCFWGWCWRLPFPAP